MRQAIQSWQQIELEQFIENYNQRTKTSKLFFQKLGVTYPKIYRPTQRYSGITSSGVLMGFYKPSCRGYTPKCANKPKKTNLDTIIDH